MTTSEDEGNRSRTLRIRPYRSRPAVRQADAEAVALRYGRRAIAA